MNLHLMAAGAIGTVNPFVPAAIRVSTGATTGASGKRTPTYAAPVTVSAQVQALSWKDLQQLDGINMNGERRAIYLEGQFDGVVRPTMKGGDLIELTTGANVGIWLVAQVLEQWSDSDTKAWCKCACTLQNGA